MWAMVLGGEEWPDARFLLTEGRFYKLMDPAYDGLLEIIFSISCWRRRELSYRSCSKFSLALVAVKETDWGGASFCVLSKS
jgi:hypothetical protein